MNLSRKYSNDQLKIFGGGIEDRKLAAIARPDDAQTALLTRAAALDTREALARNALTMQSFSGNRLGRCDGYFDLPGAEFGPAPWVSLETQEAQPNAPNGILSRAFMEGDRLQMVTECLTHTIEQAQALLREVRDVAHSLVAAPAQPQIARLETIVAQTKLKFAEMQRRLAALPELERVALEQQQPPIVSNIAPMHTAFSDVPLDLSEDFSAESVEDVLVESPMSTELSEGLAEMQLHPSDWPRAKDALTVLSYESGQTLDLDYSWGPSSPAEPATSMNCQLCTSGENSFYEGAAGESDRSCKSDSDWIPGAHWESSQPNLSL